MIGRFLTRCRYKVRQIAARHIRVTRQFGNYALMQDDIDMCVWHPVRGFIAIGPYRIVWLGGAMPKTRSFLPGSTVTMFREPSLHP